jgi:hypothetical protein
MDEERQKGGEERRKGRGKKDREWKSEHVLSGSLRNIL